MKKSNSQSLVVVSRQPQKHRTGLAKEGLTLFLEKGRISTMGDSTVAGSHLHS